MSTADALQSALDRFNRGEELPPHPVAALFPPLSPLDDSFAALVKSIREHGLREAIVVDDDGRVLDGRHRLRACREAGVAPRFNLFRETDWGGTADDFAFELNIARRHLTDDQRVAIAAAFVRADWKKAADAKRAAKMKAAKGDTPRRDGSSTTRPAAPAAPPERTHEAVAKKANVSEHKARAALDVKEHAPEELAKVAKGEKKLAEAKKVADEKKAEKKPAAKKAAATVAPKKPARSTYIDHMNALERFEKACRKITAAHDEKKLAASTSYKIALTALSLVAHLAPDIANTEQASLFERARNALMPQDRLARLIGSGDSNGAGAAA